MDKAARKTHVKVNCDVCRVIFENQHFRDFHISTYKFLNVEQLSKYEYVCVICVYKYIY